MVLVTPQGIIKYEQSRAEERQPDHCAKDFAYPSGHLVSYLDTMTVMLRSRIIYY
jgi:hypothetical protein